MALNPFFPRYDDFMVNPFVGINSSMADPWCLRAQRDMDRFGQMMNNTMRSDFGMDMRPSSLEEYRSMTNPIVTDADGNKQLQMHFDLKHFKPEEIKIECSGNKLSVEANHEFQDEKQSVRRHYHRQVTIPEEVDPTDLKSTLNQGGVMTIHAPVKRAIESPPAVNRELKITHK